MRQITFKFSNRALYTLILIGVLIISSWIVFAYGGNSPSIMGHSVGEIEPPSGCADDQLLQWSGNAWICVDKGTKIQDAGGPISPINFKECQWTTCSWDNEGNLGSTFGPGTCHSFTTTSKYVNCPPGWRILSGGGACGAHRMRSNRPLMRAWDGSLDDPQAWNIDCELQTYQEIDALCCH